MSEPQMQAVAVLPLHDPAGNVLPHFVAILPQLQTLFARAFLGVTPATAAGQAEYVARLEADDFAHLIHVPLQLAVGEQFRALYEQAATSCHPRQLLHLCFPDRVAFALRGAYREAFVRDLSAVAPAETPLLFQRSRRAWRTHPRNYRRLEQMLTHTGELLFGRSLDFAWCHLVVQAEQLAGILPHVKARDFSMMAEMVLLLREKMRTRDVDWLAWEDPFILSRAAEPLRREREQDAAETRKRLAYVIPMLQRLQRVADPSADAS